VKRFVSLQFLNLRQSVGPLGHGISPSQGRYLIQDSTNTEETETNIHACSGIRYHNPRVRAIEDISCLRPRGHSDQLHPHRRVDLAIPTCACIMKRTDRTGITRDRMMPHCVNTWSTISKATETTTAVRDNPVFQWQPSPGRSGYCFFSVMARTTCQICSTLDIRLPQTLPVSRNVVTSCCNVVLFCTTVSGYAFLFEITVANKHALCWASAQLATAAA
jgi:hypothetical protein